MLAKRLILLGGKPKISFAPGALLDNATVSTVVGTATITGARVKGTASWSLSNNAGGLFAINSSTAVVTVNGALTAGTYTITIAVSGLTPAATSASFVIMVTSSAGVFLQALYATPNTTEAWVLW